MARFHEEPSFDETTETIATPIKEPHQKTIEPKINPLSKTNKNTKPSIEFIQNNSTQKIEGIDKNINVQKNVFNIDDEEVEEEDEREVEEEEKNALGRDREKIVLKNVLIHDNNHNNNTDCNYLDDDNEYNAYSDWLSDGNQRRSPEGVEDNSVVPNVEPIDVQQIEQDKHVQLDEKRHKSKKKKDKKDKNHEHGRDEKKEKKKKKKSSKETEVNEFFNVNNKMIDDTSTYEAI